MRIAIVSDLHANRLATDAVFQHIDAQGDISRIICLGDAIGYGPNPVDVLSIVMARCEFCLLGNHEEAILRGAVNFNPKAKMAIEWTGGQLTANPADTAENNAARKQYLEAMPEFISEGKNLYVHGSPRQYTREYVMPRDAFDRKKMNDIYAKMGDHRLCFDGHTHQPGVFSYEGYFHPSEMYNAYFFGENEKLVINVGSVGQPRDGDARACYVTLTDDCIVWHRVAYNVEEVRKQIYAVPELDNYLGDRLVEGR